MERGTWYEEVIRDRIGGNVEGGEGKGEDKEEVESGGESQGREGLKGSKGGKSGEGKGNSEKRKRGR